VDERSLTTLKGNVPLLARPEYDQGEASPSTPLTHIRLVLSRTSAQEAALEQYLVQLQDKSSPNFHKWLTPAEFGQLYGPADSDVSALVAWLQSQGFTVETVSKARTNIAFSGSVSQVEAAFHTSIHSFSANGTQFYSNTTDPRIPSALAPVVMGVAHLNTIRPTPQFIQGNAGRYNPETKRLEPLNTATANQPRPSLTGGLGTASSPYVLFLVPGDAATIYDTPNSFNANFSGGTSYNGKGVIIGIGGDATIDPTIVANGYRNTFLGKSIAPILKYNYCTTSSSCSSTPRCIGGATNCGYVEGDEAEAYLDTELSGGMAPGAEIDYYASIDLTTGIEAALDADTVDIFSLSFGICEQDLSTSDNEMINRWWQQAAGEGIAVTVAAGDNGSAGCDATSDSNGNNIPDAVGGLQVSGFASTPYNIAVGGTDFYPLVNSYSTYVNTPQGSSSTYFRTASNYIPESTWNDSTSSNTTISENEPLSAAGFPAKDNNIVAGSGGASNCSTNTTVDTSTTYKVGNCTSGYSKPSWQTGAGVPADGARDLPDVSLMAGNGFDNAIWLVCDNATTTNSAKQTVPLDCEVQSDGNFYFDGYGGTSAAAPSFAGILALVQQMTGSRLGQAAQTLYAFYNSSFASAAFHDVTVGNNSVPCTSSTPNCVKDTAGYYYESGYNTTADYDLATGLGSVDATQLLNYWNAAASLAAPTVTMAPPKPNPVTVLQNLSASVSVTGSGATPTGTVTLVSGSYTSGAKTRSSGSYTFTVPAGSLPIGSDVTLTANYSGDSTYAAATNSTTVTVTQSDFSLSATNISSLAPGATTGNTSTVTVNSITGYPGTVTLSCALTNSPSGATDLPTCSVTSGSPVTLSSGTTSGKATITVSTTLASAALAYPKLPGKGRGWAGAGSGMVLALLLFLGVPARRRSWRSMLGILAMMAALGSLAACGSRVSNIALSNPIAGTTAGTYTFTITGTGDPAVTPAPTTTFTVTVT
jgi:subtilase family serine protease